MIIIACASLKHDNVFFPFYSKDLHTLVNTWCVFTSGEDARVHESGHAEVGKGEEEDHSNIDGNDRGKIL